MKRNCLLLLGCVLLVSLAWLGHGHRRPAALPPAVPEGVGLSWQECAVSVPYSWQQAEACFGHPMPLIRDEPGRWGERAEGGNWHLTIGADTYHTRASISWPGLRSLYTLYRNRVPVASLWGEFTAYSPSISLQNVAGKSAWEFADHQVGTILYDGQDLRRMYGLDAAYSPYGLGDHLIFVAKRDSRYFVVYEGQRIGPDFDEIAIAYCCEPVLWSVQRGQGRYLFWSREGRSYVAEVTRGDG